MKGSPGRLSPPRPSRAILRSMLSRGPWTRGAILLLALLDLPGRCGAAEPLPWLAPPPARLVVAEGTFDFGEVYQFATVEHRFPIANPSDRPVRILSATAISEAATVRFAPPVIPAGGKGEVTVVQPVGDKLGQVAFRVKLLTDDPGLAEKKLSLRGFVQSAYDPERGFLDFGEIERAAGASREVEVATRQAATLRFAGVDGPDWLAVEPAGEASAAGPLRLRVTVKPGAPQGMRAGQLFVRTDLADQARFELSYRLNVQGDIRASEGSIDLGLARLGQATRRDVRLVRKSGAALHIERVEGAVPGLRVADLPCEEGVAASPCRLLRLELTPQETGGIAGTLSVFAAGEAEPLPLPFAALAVAADTQVKDITADLGQGGGAKPAPPVAIPPPAPKRPPAPPAEPSHKREVVLHWQSQREQGVYGYLIYRAESRSGPFVRINRETVRVPDDGQPAHPYRYVDRAVEPGKTYFYYVDTVSLGGKKQGFSGVLSRQVAADAAP
jgi:hypothetical protein